MPFPSFTNPFSRPAPSMSRKKVETDQPHSHPKFGLGMPILSAIVPDHHSDKHPSSHSSAPPRRSQSMACVVAALTLGNQPAPVHEVVPPAGLSTLNGIGPAPARSPKKKHPRTPPLRLAARKAGGEARRGMSTLMSTSRSRSASTTALGSGSVNQSRSGSVEPESLGTARDEGPFDYARLRSASTAARPSMLRRASSLDSGAPSFLGPLPPRQFGDESYGSPEGKHSACSSISGSVSSDAQSHSPAPSTAQTTPLSSAAHKHQCRSARLPTSPRIPWTRSRSVRGQLSHRVSQNTSMHSPPPGWTLDFANWSWAAGGSVPDVAGPLLTLRQEAGSRGSVLEPTLQRRVTVDGQGLECNVWEVRLALPPRRYGSTPITGLSPPQRLQRDRDRARTRQRSKTCGLKIGPPVERDYPPIEPPRPDSPATPSAAYSRRLTLLANLEEKSSEHLLRPKQSSQKHHYPTEPRVLNPEQSICPHDPPLRKCLLKDGIARSESDCKMGDTDEHGQGQQNLDCGFERRLAHNKLMGMPISIQIGIPNPQPHGGYSFSTCFEHDGDHDHGRPEGPEPELSLIGVRTTEVDDDDDVGVGVSWDRQVAAENSYWSETDASVSNLGDDPED